MGEYQPPCTSNSYLTLLHCSFRFAGCGSGRFEVSDDSGTNVCIDCPAGWYGVNQSAVMCTPCAVGKYVATPGSSNPQDCNDCPAAWYSADGPTAVCTPCTVGKYMATTGSSNADDCLPCSHADSTPPTDTSCGLLAGAVIGACTGHTWHANSTASIEPTDWWSDSACNRTPARHCSLNADTDTPAICDEFNFLSTGPATSELRMGRDGTNKASLLVAEFSASETSGGRSFLSMSFLTQSSVVHDGACSASCLPLSRRQQRPLVCTPHRTFRACALLFPPCSPGGV